MGESSTFFTHSSYVTAKARFEAATTAKIKAEVPRPRQSGSSSGHLDCSFVEAQMSVQGSGSPPQGVHREERCQRCQQEGVGPRPPDPLCARPQELLQVEWSACPYKGHHRHSCQRCQVSNYAAEAH